MLTTPKYYSPGDAPLSGQDGAKRSGFQLNIPRNNTSPRSFSELLDYAPNAPPLMGGADFNMLMDDITPTRDMCSKEELTDMPREKGADRVIPTYEQPSKKSQKSIHCGDPRFIGKVNQLEVQRNYAFIGELRREELKECDAQYRALPEDTPAEQREILRAKLLKLKKQVGEMERRKAETEMREKLVKAELRAIAQGKKADFVKDKDIKRFTSESLYCASAGTRRGDRKLQKARKKRGSLTM